MFTIAQGSAAGGRDMAADYQDKINRSIKKLLDAMEPLPRRLSDLMQQHRGRRRVSAAVGRRLRSMEFIQTELSGLVESLSQLMSSELGPDYIDNDDFKRWLRALSLVPPDIRDYIQKSEQAARFGWHAQLHRAAAYVFLRAAGLPLPFLREVHVMEEILSMHAERNFRYSHLVLPDDGDHTSTSTTSSSPQPLTSRYVIEDLVGIEDTMKSKVVKRFMDDNDPLKVICIVGPAGVGKTALAMEIYHQLQYGPSAKAMVKVSHNPVMKELLKNILSQIQPPQITTLEDEQELRLVRDINKYLQDKRYLIVVDDLWRKSDWDKIKDAFPLNNLCSRIVVTTRITSVARFCCLIDGYLIGDVHEVMALNGLDSERLLFRRAFGSRGPPPAENLKQVCDEILRRCEGIPLFIIGMADWLKERWVVQHQHISASCSLEKSTPVLKRFERTLSPTYDNLPYDVKLQLLYMSMFPGGYTFEKNSFGKKLAAELLSESRTDADYCFSELTDRNVITRVTNYKHAPHQLEEGCHWKVNYFMLEFIASKSASMGFVYTSGTLASAAARGGVKMKPRRLSLHLPDAGLPEVLTETDLSHTRSVAVSGRVERVPLREFTCLMVLDLEGWQCIKEQDLLLICEMVRLRHLSLRKTGVRKLPAKIKNLHNLEKMDVSHTQLSELPSQVRELSELRTLDLTSTPIKQLPKQIWKMLQLQHLFLGGIGDNLNETVLRIPEEIGGLTDLHTLATIDLNECSASLVEALGCIRWLRVLVITWYLHQSTDRKFQQALISSMEKWEVLKSLTIHCGFGCPMEFLDSLYSPPRCLEKFKVTGGRFLRVPEWFLRLDCLAIIEINLGWKVQQSDLAILGNLPELECLVLGLYFIPETETVIDGEVFQNLERLCVSSRVPWLTFRQGAMPELTHLQLNILGDPDCENSVSGISNLQCLSEVDLRYRELYINSQSIQATVKAVRKGVAEHRKQIELLINGKQDQDEDVDEYPAASATESQCEIDIED